MIDLYFQVYGDQLNTLANALGTPGDQLQQTVGSVMNNFIPGLLLVPVAYALSSGALSSVLFLI